MSNFSHLLANTAVRWQPSAIRRLVPYLRQPDIISFAGGWPAADLFPVDKISQITAEVLVQEGAAVLQYGDTRGDARLIDWLRARLAHQHGYQSHAEQWCITTGGQQALFLLAEILLTAGDCIVVEAPTYSGALSIFHGFGADVRPVAMDEDGLNTAVLAAQLAAGLRPKFVYTIPDYQNPTGRQMSQPRRSALCALAEQYDFLIIEDAPYADLRYAGTAVPPIIALDPHGRTLHLGSFSKIFAPLRLGWMVGPAEIVAQATIAKQSIDLCTPQLTQAIAYEFAQRGWLDEHIQVLRAAYGQKRQAMLAALDSHLPDGVQWTEPQGGMFVWVTLPPTADADALFFKAIEQKVAFVVGSAFYPTQPDTAVPRHEFRLNFITPSIAQIQTGIASLAKVIDVASQQVRLID